MTKNQWVVIRDCETREAKRYNLASMQKLDIGVREGLWSIGVSVEEVYYMPRARKLILETYSIWENPKTHGCYGRAYEVAGPEAIVRLAQITDNEVIMSLIPLGEDE